MPLNRKTTRHEEESTQGLRAMEHQENGRQDVIVGMVGTRFAGLDGVSLEADKLGTVLEDEGHQVVWFAGELGDRFRPGLLHPPAHFGHPAIRSLEAELFGKRPPTPAAIRSLRDRTRELKTALRWFLRDFEVDVLIVQNALCLPMNVPLGVALAELLAETGVPAVAHHHDFAWERERFRRPQLPDMLRAAFPPALPGLWHVVIQSAAREQLQRRRGIASTVLPNVMDFEEEPVPGDGAAYRAAAGLGPDDLLLLQPTRVVPRKGIETTLRLASELDDGHVKVVVSHHEGDEGFGYGRRLREEADRLGVDLIFAPVRAEYEQDPTRPLLADAYAAADLVCYPSRYEGFGNALLEAIYHRRPLLVNRYPVYVRDIAPTGVECLEIDGGLSPEAVARAAKLLEDPGQWRDSAERNYEIGRRHFSFAVVRERFLPLIASVAPCYGEQAAAMEAAAQ
jgi:glycosyltransferase involved in cell wall biosynthesis